MIMDREGKVHLQIPPTQVTGPWLFVDLPPGTYDITVSLYDYAVLRPFDFRHKVLRFDVESGDPHESYGVVSLGGRWLIGESAKSAKRG